MKYVEVEVYEANSFGVNEKCVSIGEGVRRGIYIKEPPPVSVSQVLLTPSNCQNKLLCTDMRISRVIHMYVIFVRAFSCFVN